MANLARVLTVPFDRLMACINETPSVDVEQACDAIMRDMDGALFSKETGQIQWKGFPSPPSSSDLNEDEAFMPLVDVFEAVFANVRGCGLSLVMNGHSTPRFERGNKSRPDALLIRSRSRAVTPSNHWNDIVVPFEFKKGADARDANDNQQKIIRSLHYIMREDPCRRFAFGITIEDSNLRLWLGNRAFLAASQPINFLQEIERTIRLFTSLAWASVASDMEGLGWDPTIKRLGDGPDSWQYEFKVGDETFTTTKALATYGADSLVGRATRVYEAKDSKGNTVAIKDSWRDADRKPEGETLEDILKSCNGKLTKEEADEARKAFVQIKLYGDVYVSDRRDETANLMEGMTDVLWEKIHWQALYLLHRAGWVHRDFSGGNVMRISDRGKLGDFEFAKEVDPGDLAHEVRTGMMDFMAVEVGAHQYLFATEPAGAGPITLTAFRANFLHDFESVWWAFAWVLFYHTDKNSNDKEKAQRQHEEYKRAFPGWVEAAARLVFFTMPFILRTACETLCDTCSPLADDLRFLKTALLDHYRLAEMSYPKIDASPELLETVYEKVSTHLQHALDLATDVELCSVAKISVSKRSRTDEECGSGGEEESTSLLTSTVVSRENWSYPGFAGKTYPGQATSSQVEASRLEL